MRRHTPILTLAAALFITALTTHHTHADEPRPRQRDLYLASRDEIRAVLRIIDESPKSPGGSFIGIVGGLAFLNFIEPLVPSQLLLVDLNPAQVEYGRCIVQLIEHSPDRATFVSAFFSRPFRAEADEAAFLAQPGDEALLDATVQPIADRALRASCREDLALIARATYDPETHALVVARNANGKYLQLRGPERGMPIGYNFLYYGRGWLASNEAYAHTRAILQKARVRFLASDIGAVPLDDVRGRHIFFWGTNLATWYREGADAYQRFVISAHEAFAARNQHIRFVFTSTYRRPAWTELLPFEQRGDGVHLDASAKVRKYTQGKRVLELIPGKAYFGRELRAADVVVQNAAQPIDDALSFDAAVLHILNNSGMRWWQADRDAEFRALYDLVLARASDVVILEHNARSPDFTDKERARMVGLDKLLEPLFPLLAKRRLALTLEPAVGHQDQARNLVLHVQKR